MLCYLFSSRLIDSKEHSRMWYRVGAVRELIGGHKLQPLLTEKLQQVSYLHCEWLAGIIRNINITVFSS
jgi:hypothetical protein